MCLNFEWLALFITMLTFCNRNNDSNAESEYIENYKDGLVSALFGVKNILYSQWKYERKIIGKLNGFTFFLIFK